MGDTVQARMELIMREVEEMQRIKLFTPYQISQIIKKMRSYEEKIANVRKDFQDFKTYINYLKTLLKDIQHNRNKFKIAEKKGRIEYNIIRRIKDLYEIALERFSNDFSIWLQYVNFCKKSNYGNAATTAINNMLTAHPYKSEVWILAYEWYLKNENKTEALKILRRGLLHHKSNHIFYLKVIELELSLPNSDEIKNKVIQVYIDELCSNITNLNNLFELLNLLERYKFSMSSQIYFISKLIHLHSNKEIVWHVLAQRERRGFHYKKQNKGEEVSPRILCGAKYKEGLAKVADSEKVKLWQHYLDYLIEINSNETTRAFTEANKQHYLLEENYYIKWLSLVGDDQAEEILRKGTRALPQSIVLWKMRLKYAILAKDIPSIKKIFNKAVSILKDKSLILWDIYLQFHFLMSGDDEIETIYQKAAKQSGDVGQFYKPKYLEWLAMFKGIDEARAVYDVLAILKPHCKELHNVMSKLESFAIKYNFERWGKVLRLACEQFGDKDIDVWINRIVFYVKYDVNTQKAKEVNNEAQWRLSPLLFNDFREKLAETI